MAAFKRLEKAGADGIASGDIARELEVPHNTLSNHLSILVSAGLATSERRSRSIIYRAREGAVDRLRDALV